MPDNKTVTVEYVGPGTDKGRKMQVTPDEAEALAERGLWRRASSAKKKEEKEVSDA